MPANLPMDLLRTFVTIVDEGSISGSAERIFLTPSALSLQMKRLSELAGADIFCRAGRRLALTPTGESLLVNARELIKLNDNAITSLAKSVGSEPIRIGMSPDFAEAILSKVLAQFSTWKSKADLQVEVAPSRELIDLLASGALDLVVILSGEDDPSAISIGQMHWFGDSTLCERPVVPLALADEPCTFRTAALGALSRARRPYRIIVETKCVSLLREAVNDGLALTCSTTTFYGHRKVDQGDLPAALPRVAYSIKLGPFPSQLVRRLSSLIKNCIKPSGSLAASAAA